MDKLPVVDVLIVGAGPTGLVLAAQLAALGIQPRIIDRQPTSVRESRALAIQPRTLEMLQNIGITQRLIERGNTTANLCIHFSAGTLSTPLFNVGLDDTQFPFMLFLSQAETESILIEHLEAQGIFVERGAELIDAQQNEQDVLCTVQDNSGEQDHFKSQFVIGCDGAHSTVRKLAGIPFVGDVYPQSFVLADLEVDGDLEPGSVHTFPGEAGILFFFPLARPATWRMIASRPAADGAGAFQESSAVTLGELQKIVDSFTPKRQTLRDPVWLTQFRVARRQATAYRKGRIFLAGDAAHIHSPAGGQGMNTGIQDAINLGWKLALVLQERAPDSLLDTYHDERWPVGNKVLQFTDRAFRLVTSKGSFAQFMRKNLAPHIAPALLRSNTARKFGFRTISQLGINYRKSALSKTRSLASARVVAGDRMPDVSLLWQGKPSWLHDMLAGPGFDLLLCGPIANWPEHQLAAIQRDFGDLVNVHFLTQGMQPNALCDPDGKAPTRLGVSTAAQFLIRPDGYIAYCSNGNNLTGVTDYFGLQFSRG